MERKPQIATDLKQPAPEAWHEVRCDECRRCANVYHLRREVLEDFCARVFESLGVPAPDARVTAESLVAADLRGIPSHGVARLGRYVTGLEQGHIRAKATLEIHEPAPAIGLIDAKDALGQVASARAMALAVEKARRQGVGLVTVRNSNHFGIAGHWVRMALAQDMLGMCMTNSAPLVIPTHGAKALLGTNPIAFGLPGGDEPAFLLDMATSVVPRGKVEVYDRDRKQMPLGWAVDESGLDAVDPARVLRNLIERLGGGILPLGGRGELFSGYKGYGLAALVDILCGVLSGSAYLDDVDNVHSPHAKGAAPRVGHFMLAVDVARFIPLSELKKRMDDFVRRLRESPRAVDADRIFVAGEREHEKELLHAREGIPVKENVMQALLGIGRDRGVAPPTCLEPAGR